MCCCRGMGQQRCGGTLLAGGSGRWRRRLPSNSAGHQHAGTSLRHCHKKHEGNIRLQRRTQGRVGQQTRAGRRPASPIGLDTFLWLQIEMSQPSENEKAALFWEPAAAHASAQTLRTLPCDRAFDRDQHRIASSRPGDAVVTGAAGSEPRPAASSAAIGVNQRCSGSC